MSEGARPLWADRYVRQKRLGDGGQGTTLLVHSVATGEPYALKEMHEKQQRDPGRRNRMRIEAATLEVLDHTGIPRVVEHNGQQFRDLDVPLYLVMKFAQGGTLTQRVEKDGPLGVDTALAVAIRLLDTLAYCHGQEVVHRDVKPDNIAFRATGLADPVLLDFGLTFNWRLADTRATRSGEQLGNRFLHLPELQAGADRRDPRSDVTQCAGVLVFMLTGIEPVSLFDGRGFAPHQRPDQHERLAGLVPPSLLAFFDQAFQQRLGDRFQSADSARMALTDLGATGERVGRSVSAAKRIRDRVLDDDVYVGEAASGAVIEQIRETLNRAVKRAHAELAIAGTATRTADFHDGGGHLQWAVTAGLVLDAGVRFVALPQFLLQIVAREVILTPAGEPAPLIRAPLAGFVVSDAAVAAVCDMVMATVEREFDRAMRSRAADPVVTPALKRAVVDVVVSEQLKTGGNASGAAIMMGLGTASRALAEKAIDACVPRLLLQGNPRPADNYRPTLAGVLASSQGERAREFIRRVLAHWKAVAPANPDRARIRSDQEEFHEFDLQFMLMVMTIARLGGDATHRGPEQPFDLGVPFRLLDVLECSTADELVAQWDRDR